MAITYLYNSGNECTALTGGWFKVKGTTFNKSSTEFELLEYNGECRIATTNLINLSKYKKLCMEISYTRINGTTGDMRMYLLDNTNNYTSYSNAVKVTGILEWNISSITTLSKVSLNAYFCDMKVSKVWLEDDTTSAGIYIGVNDVARTVKKICIGVDNKARKIKKAYIGVGNVARPVFSGGELVYYGPITPMRTARGDFGSCSTGSHTIFASGRVGTGYTKNVDAYSGNLELIPVASLSAGRKFFSGARLGNNGILGGGLGSSNATYNDVYLYDSNLTQTTLTSLVTTKRSHSVASNENYAIFGSGYNVKTVEAYDKQFNRLSATDMAGTIYDMVGVTTPQNALFFGGYITGTTARAGVFGYDSQLTFKTLTSLSYLSQSLGGAVAGKHVIVCGGHSGATDTASNLRKFADAYDENLVKTCINDLSSARTRLAGTTLGGCAIFGGGANTTVKVNHVDIYDENLTKKVVSNLTTARNSLCAEPVGDYALFAGGLNDNTDSLTEVECFKF